MIFNYKGKEYCLTDWKINPNDVFVSYRNIVTNDGKNNNFDFIAVLSSDSNTFSLNCGGICRDISYMYRQIYKTNYLKVQTLKEARDRVDEFISRIDNIKIFI